MFPTCISEFDLDDVWQLGGLGYVCLFCFSGRGPSSGSVSLQSLSLFDLWIILWVLLEMPLR